MVEGINHRRTTDRTGIAPPMNRSHKMPSASSTRFQRVIPDRNRGNPYPATNTNHNGLEPSRRRAHSGTVTYTSDQLYEVVDKGNYRLGGRAPYCMRFVFMVVSLIVQSVRETSLEMMVRLHHNQQMSTFAYIGGHQVALWSRSTRLVWSWGI